MTQGMTCPLWTFMSINAVIAITKNYLVHAT